VTDVAGAAVVFNGNGTIKFDPGLADFSAGVSVFATVWPQLDGAGNAGTVVALGPPPVQGDCGRLFELSIGNFGVEYRVEGEVVGAQGFLDGRGWDVVSVVHLGWTQNVCSNQANATVRHGQDVVGQQPVVTLGKGVRVGTVLGDSFFFSPDLYRGKLGELLLYTRALGDDDVKRVTTYLDRRWSRP
jgi:hypothetical protein